MKYFLSALLIVSASLAFADDFDATEAKLKTAMSADIRTDAEKDRDRNRRPVRTLKFFGLRDDMKVVELLPGGGWYTKLLVPVVQENKVLGILRRNDILNYLQLHNDLGTKVS